MWRIATEDDDDVLAELCIALHREDPGPLPEHAHHMRGTLAILRREPWRGRAIALEVEERVVGYALLVAFWSNGLGGEVCEIDELYVDREFRGRGFGAALFGAMEAGELWPAPTVALALGVTPGNARAYERLGFVAAGVSMVKMVRPAG
jgi:GNAT superfamily N-acetyltransferase